MNLVETHNQNHKVVLSEIPPLIKAYLRLGSKFADGAVINKQFGTTDVLVILPKVNIAVKYIKHFS